MWGVKLSVGALAIYCMLLLSVDSVAGIKQDHQESRGVKQDILQKIAAAPFGCPPLPQKRNLTSICSSAMIKNMSCAVRVPLGTKAAFKCADNYVLAQKYRSIKCVFPGRWSKTAVSCKPKPTRPTSSSTEVSTDTEGTSASEDTSPSEEPTSAETTIATTAVETTAAVAQKTSPPSTESVATTTEATTTTTTTATTTTAATTTTTTTTTTEIPTTTQPPGYEPLLGVGYVKPCRANTLVNAIADCKTAGATVLAVTDQTRLDYVNRVMANPSFFNGSVNSRDMWSGVERKNNEWQTFKGVNLTGHAFFKFYTGAAKTNYLATFVKDFQAHWDYSVALAFSLTLPYICEK